MTAAGRSADAAGQSSDGGGAQAALEGQQFELATELLRFLVPPGRHDAFLAATRQPRQAKAALDAAVARGVEAPAATEPTESPQQQAPKSGVGTPHRRRTCMPLSR